MTRSANKPPEQVLKKQHNPQATRETVESIVIAVILAFLFRGFVAEAFVIPTGSMAPTLMGRHMDVTCPDCGYAYQTGASEENDDGTRSGMVKVTYCPLCRFPKKLDSVRNPNEASFTGDRILVSKYEYELEHPQRWDVIVFKYPHNAKQNYIKRLVGLPNELVQIHHGDVYIGKHLFDIEREDVDPLAGSDDLALFAEHFRRAGFELSSEATLERLPTNQHPYSVRTQDAESIWLLDDPTLPEEIIIRLPEYEGPARVFTAPRIMRKPPLKERALLQLVYDTEYQGELLVRARWPSRWQDRSGTPVWTELEPGKFEASGSENELVFLRYRHIYPSAREWEHLVDHESAPPLIDRINGELIADFYAYNDRISTDPQVTRNLGTHWVGDLAVEAEVEVQSGEGQLALDLVEAGVHYRCTIDIKTGTATLSISNDAPFVSEEGVPSEQAPTASTSVRGSGSHTIRFVNADDQLRLWVDGDVVNFDGPTTYQPIGPSEPQWSEEGPGDLAPAGIGIRNAKVRVDRLKLFRDVYYVATTQQGSDYAIQPLDSELLRIFRTPSEWQRTKLFQSRKTVEFVIDDRSYFPLGDNSPYSSDGRMWEAEPYFSESMLIGKAMLIYWPHGWNRPIPFLPNFKRMQLIH